MSAWTALTPDLVRAQLPTDLETLYKAWIDTNPAKSTRLADLTALAVAAFRTAAGANPACTLDPDPTMVPTVAYLHAFNTIVYSLGMEMGVEFDSNVYQMIAQANIWLRMAPVSRCDITGAETAGSKPTYRVRRRDWWEWENR